MVLYYVKCLSIITVQERAVLDCIMCIFYILLLNIKLTFIGIVNFVPTFVLSIKPTDIDMWDFDDMKIPTTEVSLCCKICQKLCRFKTQQKCTDTLYGKWRTQNAFVLCGSQNKQRLFPYTALIDWFVYRDWVCLMRGTDWTFNIQQFYVLPTQRICVFCVDLRTNSDYFLIQH